MPFREQPKSIMPNVPRGTPIASVRDLKPEATPYLINDVLQGESRPTEPVLQALVGIPPEQVRGHLREKVSKLCRRSIPISELTGSSKGNNLLDKLVLKLVSRVYPQIGERHDTSS
jgi:hypothetical protein